MSMPDRTDVYQASSHNGHTTKVLLHITRRGTNLRLDPDADEAGDVPAAGDGKGRSGPPTGVTPAKSKRPAKRMQKRGLTVPEGVLRERVGPHQFTEVFTAKWKGTMFGGSPEWAWKVVGAVAPVGQRSIMGLTPVLAQLAFAETTKEGGKPRASTGERIRCNGVWWFLVSATEWSKLSNCSVRSIGIALDTLVTLNLVERKLRRGTYGLSTPYYRIRWEVVKYLLTVAKVMTPRGTSA